MAALNTGNNVLYLVFAAMLSLVLASGFLSESSLRGIEVTRRIHGRVFANRPACGTWMLRSRRRLLPGLAIEVREAPAPRARLAARGEAVVPWLRAGQQESRTGDWVFAVRGIHRLRGVRVSTTWPFGILRKWYEVQAPLDVLVCPEPVDDWQEVATEAPAGLGSIRDARRRGGTGDLAGLRDHRTGEDLRLVHWRSTARLRRRVAVERDREDAGRVEVHIGSPAAGDPVERAARVERRLGQATAAVLAAARRGAEVVLVLPDGPLPAARDDAGVDELLRRIALLEVP
jgi:uncharacterized protein (DUF58 family)